MARAWRTFWPVQGLASSSPRGQISSSTACFRKQSFTLLLTYHLWLLSCPMAERLRQRPYGLEA